MFFVLLEELNSKFKQRLRTWFNAPRGAFSDACPFTRLPISTTRLPLAKRLLAARCGWCSCSVSLWEAAASFQGGMGGPRPLLRVQKLTTHLCSGGRPWGARALSPESCGHRRQPEPTNVKGTSAVAFSLILVRSDKGTARRHLLGRFEGQFSNVEPEKENGPPSSRPLSPVALRSAFDQQPFCNEGRTAGGCLCALLKTLGTLRGPVVSCFRGREHSLSSAH